MKRSALLEEIEEAGYDPVPSHELKKQDKLSEEEIGVLDEASSDLGGTYYLGKEGKVAVAVPKGFRENGNLDYRWSEMETPL